MIKRIFFILSFSIIYQSSIAQGLTLDILIELRPKSISELDKALIQRNYELESAINKDDINQTIYKAKSKAYRESITLHNYKGRDNFITYFYKSSKIELNLLTQIKNKKGKLIKEDVTPDGSIRYVYKTANYVFFIAKDKTISTLTIYTIKDYNLYYKI